MNVFKNFSFKTKLVMLCLFMAAVSVTIGGIAYNGLHEVSTSYNKIPDAVMPKLEFSNEMFVEYRRVRITIATLALAGISKQHEIENTEAANKSIENFDAAEKNYLSLALVPGQKELHAEVHSSWQTFKAEAERALALHKSGKPEDREAMLKLLLNEFPDSAKAFTKHITKLLDFHKDTGKVRVQEAKAEATAANTLILLVASLGVLCGLGVGIIFATVVSRSISSVAKNLSESADEVSAASTQIAASSQELSQAATEQAASLQETASAVEELSSMVTKNTDNAKNTASLSSESQAKANEGKEAVERMMQSMEEINHSNESIMNQINTSNQQMVEIVKVIQEIGNKTKVINDIVFQTKLLSFNASVEAARAGEHGKGFAVVAEEVGNLARMSGNAAKEISEMLDGSIQKVEGIVSDTKTKVEALVSKGKTKVEAGVEVARHCGDILNEIVTNVSSVSTMSVEISGASQEQAQGIGEINKAMNQLDQVTQQNAAASGQTASSAESLSTQAETLKGAVQELIRTISGRDGHNATQSHARHSRPKVTATSSSKVVHLKPKKSAAAGHTSNVPLKMASGDSFVPDRNDPGFGEG